MEYLYDKKIVWLLCPAYNEDKIIEISAEKLIYQLNNLISNNIISSESKILFIDDGSDDETWNKIEKLHSNNNFVRGLKLATNVGQEKALYAGIEYAKDYCDAVITLDADLQDDISKLYEFILKFYEGRDIVYGIHYRRNNDKIFKRLTSISYYKLIKFLKIKSIPHHSECRLLSKMVMERLMKYQESESFLRGTIFKLSNNYDIVTYERQKRIGGETKYSYGQLFSVAIKSIITETGVPVRYILFLGILITFFSPIMLIEGFKAFSIWFLGGLQITCIGIIGEYIVLNMLQSKRQPKFFIDKIL